MEQNNKEKEIIEKVEDAILVACEKFKNGEPFNVEQLQALNDSVRILHHINQIKLGH